MQFETKKLSLFDVSAGKVPNKDLMHIPLVLPMYLMCINSWLNGGGGGQWGEYDEFLF